MTKSRGINCPRYEWDPEIERLFSMLYPVESTKRLADAIGISVFVAYRKAEGLGLKKTDAYLASEMSGRILRGRVDPRMVATQFKKGQVSWNKGNKGWQAGGRSKETQFKKGQKPHTWNPVGHERITRDGILERKVNDTGVTRADYVPVHRIVWLESGREIPPGHIVIFKDGNRKNITIGNLECISKRENMIRNSYHTRYPKEICKAIQLKGALQRQINKLEKNHEQDNQRPA
jgi:hypothetical protein